MFDRTFIGGIPAASGPGETHINSDSPAEPPRSSRKIVGWIISYTLDAMGVDYRIFEGNNTIGRDVSNSIMLSNESTISSKHMTILFKGGNFWAKDEMSANGSFLNGVEMEIQKAYPINDNDELRLGNTVFKFKSAV
jgi:pSer/pThr/pTyr-binding forkhead associated (FHA) protein